eukprot:jgi/Undpi1/4101/HiC_scaffold_16.g07468.m1
MRRGGTFGGTPPEAMQGRQVPCHPSQDVFAFAHMVLVLIVKVECKFANMFASQLCMTADDKRRLVAMDAESARIYIEYMTIRNLTEPGFRGAVLNPSIVSAQFQHMSHELIQLIDPALAVNPSERPTMQQLLRGMIGLYGRQLKFEKISSAAVAPAAAAPVSGAPPATDTLAVGAIAAFPAVAKEDAAPKETARVQRLPPGLFGGVGSVGGIGGDCSAEDGGTASGGIIPTPAVATADTAPYGTATVRRLPPGLLVADSGGASLPTPNPAATAAAITTATASATTVITATRGSGGGGDCDGDEGVCVTPSTVSWVGGQRTSCSPRLAKDGGWGEGGGGDGEVGRLGEREGPAGGGGGETTSRPRPASEGGWGGGGNGGGGEWGGGAETSWSPRSARDGGWGEEGGDGCGEEGGRRTRGKTSPRSGDNSRHYKKSAFRETGASRRPAHHGDMAPAPSVARACPRVAAGGGGNFRGSDGGDGVNVSGNGWRGDARYLPAAPSAARQVECTNSGRCGPYVRYQLPVAACGSFASQATTVEGTLGRRCRAGYLTGGDGWSIWGSDGFASFPAMPLLGESGVVGNGAGRGRVAGWVGVEFVGGE